MGGRQAGNIQIFPNRGKSTFYTGDVQFPCFASLSADTHFQDIRKDILHTLSGTAHDLQFFMDCFRRCHVKEHDKVLCICAAALPDIGIPVDEFLRRQRQFLCQDLKTWNVLKLSLIVAILP